MDDHKPIQRRKAIAPIERMRQPGLDLCKAIHIDVQRNLCKEGVIPQYLYWRRSGMYGDCYRETMRTEGGLVVGIPGGIFVARALELIYGGHGVSQLAFGVDTQAKHLALGAGVIIGFYKGSGIGLRGVWDVGIIHYRHEPRVVTPIDWNCPSAISYMHELILLYDKKYRLGHAAKERRLGPFIKPVTE